MVNHAKDIVPENSQPEGVETARNTRDQLKSIEEYPAKQEPRKAPTNYSELTEEDLDDIFSDDHRRPF